MEINAPLTIYNFIPNVLPKKEDFEFFDVHGQFEGYRIDEKAYQKALDHCHWREGDEAPWKSFEDEPKESNYGNIDIVYRIIGSDYFIRHRWVKSNENMLYWLNDKEWIYAKDFDHITLENRKRKFLYEGWKHTSDDERHYFKKGLTTIWFRKDKEVGINGLAWQMKAPVIFTNEFELICNNRNIEL